MKISGMKSFKVSQIIKERFESLVNKSAKVSFNLWKTGIVLFSAGMHCVLSILVTQDDTSFYSSFHSTSKDKTTLVSTCIDLCRLVSTCVTKGQFNNLRLA